VGTAILLCFFFNGYYTWFETGLTITRFQYVQYGICCVTGSILVSFFTVLFYSQRNFFLPNFLLGLVNLLLTVILLSEKWNKISVDGLVVTYFLGILAQGIVLLLAFVITNKTFCSIGLPDGENLKKLFRFSAFALSANIIFFLVYRIDFWFVRYQCSPADLGNYVQASKMGQIILVVPQIMASAMFPQTASGTFQQDVSEAIVKLFRLIIQVFIVLTFLIVFIGKRLFVFVFGPSFFHVQLPLLILLPGILCLSALCLLSAYFGGKGKININLRGAVYALLVVVAGNLVFIKHYSIYVAAGASTIGYAVNLGYSLGHFRKTDQFKWRELFRWKRSDCLMHFTFRYLSPCWFFVKLAIAVILNISRHNRAPTRQEGVQL
jgi:O-antigen/teichoic acid export membrane protein